MKTFALKCEHGHSFELMAKSLESLEDQQARGLVTCPYCDTDQVERTLAKPAVKGGKGRAHTQPARADMGQMVVKPGQVQAPGGASQKDLEQAYRFFAKMRAEVEKTHEDVGEKFTDEARAMHYGEKEERGIYGQASQSQIRDLIDEGVGVAPLPELPKLSS